MESFGPSSNPQAASGSKAELFDQAKHSSNTVLIGLALNIWILDAPATTEHPSIFDAIGQASDHVSWGMLDVTGKLRWKKLRTTLQ